MIYRSDIINLRNDIQEKVGQKIIVKESPGKRSKPLEKLATIEKIYPDYFRVKFEENDRSSSYNYTDIFTKSVEVKFFNGETYQPFDLPAVESKKDKRELLMNS